MAKRRVIASINICIAEDLIDKSWTIRNELFIGDHDVLPLTLLHCLGQMELDNLSKKLRAKVKKDSVEVEDVRVINPEDLGEGDRNN